MTTSSLPAVAILGAGSMGGAILSGILASGKAGPVTVTNRTPEKADDLSSDAVRSFSTQANPGANLEAIADAEVVLVGVKPAMVPDLLREIAPGLRPGTIVVSLAAGVTVATFESILPPTTPVVRSMPNTPAIVGKAVTGIAAGTTADADVMKLVREVFETCGAVIEVHEDQIDALSAISGSGPAYVFYLIEQLTVAARGMGFTEDQARLMAEQTFVGASALLDESGEDPAELRRRVTSPGGTTERAVAVLEDAHLADIFADAAGAALARAQELAAGS